MSNPPTDFSGREVVKVLWKYNYRVTNRSGSHVRLRYDHEDLAEPYLVTVPMNDPAREGTLRSIADQCGADEFDRWCEWIDDNC